MGKPKDPMNVLYMVAALLFGAMMAWNAGEIVRPPVEFGFFSKVLIFLVAVPLGYLGAKVGDLIRKLTIPDSIFTTEGMWGILKQRIFWFIVPQVIGLIIGASIGAAMVAYPLSAGERAKAEEKRQQQIEQSRIEQSLRSEQYRKLAEESERLKNLEYEYINRDQIPTVLSVSQAAKMEGRENPEYPLLLERLRKKYGNVQFSGGRTLEDDIERAQSRPLRGDLSTRIHACLIYRKFGLTGNALLRDERDVTLFNEELQRIAKQEKDRGENAQAGPDQSANTSAAAKKEVSLGNISDIGYQLGYLATCSDHPGETATRFSEWGRNYYGGQRWEPFPMPSKTAKRHMPRRRGEIATGSGDICKNSSPLSLNEVNQ